MKKPAKPIQLILVILFTIGVIFLLALLIQLTYNNSIVKMSADPDTKKPRLVEITYWQAFILCFFVGFLFPTAVIAINK